MCSNIIAVFSDWSILALDNPLHFRKNIVERIEKLVSTSADIYWEIKTTMQY